MRIRLEDLKNVQSYEIYSATEIKPTGFNFDGL